MSHDMTYEEWSIGMAKAVSAMLQTIEDNLTASIESGDCPFALPPDTTPTEIVGGAVLMVLCGMLADEDADGGRAIVMRAADKFKGMSLPGAEDIRAAADAVMDTLGAVRNRHRWN